MDPQPAYRIDYSFQGEPMSSDEYGGTRFTFSVYFRPDDLDAGLRQTIREGHIKKVDLERFFVISTDRGSVPVLTLDTATSSLCEGNYVDGHWTRTDRACEEKLTYKTAMRPSQYIAVKVTPISPAQKQFASK